MEINLESPVFVFSLDVELGWGFILRRQDTVLRMLENDPQKARDTLDRLLRLLSIYDIPATWAVVGHLLLGPEEKRSLNFHDLVQFKEGWIERDLYQNLYPESLYYFEEAMTKICDSKQKHEIGLHSFLHLPFSQCSREAAEAEISLGIQTLQKWDISPKSFIFPGNQIGHLDVLKKYGFQAYRGRDSSYYDINRSYLLRKLTGALDKIIVTPVYPDWNDGLWNIPGSMYFFGEPQMPFTFLPRIKIGLQRAIRSKKIFHIWLHPWNLLLNESLEGDLAVVLGTVAQLRDRGILRTLTMGELAQQLNHRSAAVSEGNRSVLKC